MTVTPTRSALPRYGWYLYDFGNSILIINGGLYFPQWLTQQNQVSDAVYNTVFVLSSIFLLVFGPLLGLYADRRRAAFKFLLVTSLVLCFGGAGVGLAPFLSAQDLRVGIAVVSFFVVLASYQLSLVFYNALLGKVSRTDEYELVSGRALAWGWVGGIAGILIGLFFSGRFGLTGGMSSILPSTIITGFIVLISLMLISRAPADKYGEVVHVPKRTDWRREFYDLCKRRAVWLFLIGYFLFSDAILTIQNNSTIYMEVVLRLSDNEKAYEFLLILVTSALGSIGSVPLIAKIGLKQSLLAAITICAALVVATPAFTAPIAFSTLFGLLGLINGAVWNISRVLFFRLIPEARRSTYFGFYSTFERFASILGPIAWSIPVALIDDNILRYQVAWVVMGVFLMSALIFLSRVNLTSDVSQASEAA